MPGSPVRGSGVRRQPPGQLGLVVIGRADLGEGDQQFAQVAVPAMGDEDAQHRRGGMGHRAGTVTDDSGIVTDSGQGRNRSRWTGTVGHGRPE